MPGTGRCHPGCRACPLPSAMLMDRLAAHPAPVHPTPPIHAHPPPPRLYETWLVSELADCGSLADAIAAGRFASDLVRRQPRAHAARVGKACSGWRQQVLLPPLPLPRVVCREAVCMRTASRSHNGAHLPMPSLAPPLLQEAAMLCLLDIARGLEVSRFGLGTRGRSWVLRRRGAGQARFHARKQAPARAGQSALMLCFDVPLPASFPHIGTLGTSP